MGAGWRGLHQPGSARNEKAPTEVRALGLVQVAGGNPAYWLHYSQRRILRPFREVASDIPSDMRVRGGRI